KDPIVRQVAAVSVGIVEGEPLLDLDYLEDSSAEVDLNLIASAEGEIIEVQGTAEQTPFSRAQLDAMLDVGLEGIARLVELQRAVRRRSAAVREPPASSPTSGASPGACPWRSSRPRRRGAPSPRWRRTARPARRTPRRRLSPSPAPW